MAVPRKLNYRFHDPNPRGASTDYILGILIEANQDRVAAAMQSAGLIKSHEDDTAPGKETA